MLYKIKSNNFSYNGGAPDAYFYIGTDGNPNKSGTRLQFPPGSDSTLGIIILLYNIFWDAWKSK